MAGNPGVARPSVVANPGKLELECLINSGGDARATLICDGWESGVARPSVVASQGKLELKGLKHPGRDARATPQWAARLSPVADMGGETIFFATLFNGAHTRRSMYHEC